MILRIMSPITGLVIALAVVSLAAATTWLVSDAADEWMVNVATDALVIAVTIGIVDRIVQRQARERMRPRMERALWTIGSAFHSFVVAVAYDYAQTHLHTYRPLPTEAVEVLNQWLADRPRQDARSLAELDGGAPQLLGAAVSLGDSLSEVRERDHDVVEPDLLAAIDAFISEARTARPYLSMWSPDSLGGDLALETNVEAASRVGEALVRHEAKWRQAPEEMRSAKGLHEKLVERAGKD